MNETLYRKLILGEDILPTDLYVKNPHSFDGMEEVGTRRVMQSWELIFRPVEPWTSFADKKPEEGQEIEYCYNKIEYCYKNKGWRVFCTIFNKTFSYEENAFWRAWTPPAQPDECKEAAREYADENCIYSSRVKSEWNKEQLQDAFLAGASFERGR